MSVDINKLDWRKDAAHIQVKHGDWNELVDTLIEEGYTENQSPLKTTRRSFPLGSYKFDDNKRDKDMYAVNWEGELIHFYTANDEEKNSDEHVSGGAAYKEINKQFQNLYHLPFARAFGVWKRGELDTESKDKEYHYPLEQCNAALPAIIDCDDLCKHVLLTGVYKADISSAYPYQLTKPLPTTVGMIGPIKGQAGYFEGFVTFWTKSGHIIAEDVDTRILAQHPLYENRHKFKDIPAEEEVSYLLPLCKYSLAPIMENLYNGRKEDPKNKGVMNSFVGMLRSRKEFQSAYMGHISALVYARHIAYMCGLYDQLKRDNCYPIMYATDSIMWLGGPCRTAEKRKYLGSFTSEYENCRAVFTSCGNYAIEDPKTKALALVKHQGISKDMWATRRIETLEDFRKATVIHMSERYNKSKHKYELYEKVEI